LVPTLSLAGIQLPGADLRSADFGRMNLRGANLAGANLEGAWLHGADLGEAWLTGANLCLAQIDGANFSRAHTDGVDWTNATSGRGHVPDGWWRDQHDRLHRIGEGSGPTDEVSIALADVRDALERTRAETGRARVETDHAMEQARDAIKWKEAYRAEVERLRTLVTSLGGDWAQPEKG
jgi:hypothetical protein